MCAQRITQDRDNQLSFLNDDDFDPKNEAKKGGEAFNSEAVIDMDLMKSQRTILKEIISLSGFDTSENQELDADDGLEDNYESKMAVGPDNLLVEKSLFTFKILIYDTHV
jgi:hypothetical protein